MSENRNMSKWERHLDSCFIVDILIENCLKEQYLSTYVWWPLIISKDLNAFSEMLWFSFRAGTVETRQWLICKPVVVYLNMKMLCKKHVKQLWYYNWLPSCRKKSLNIWNNPVDIAPNARAITAFVKHVFGFLQPCSLAEECLFPTGVVIDKARSHISPNCSITHLTLT